jgi:hypothetical protein
MRKNENPPLVIANQSFFNSSKFRKSPNCAICHRLRQYESKGVVHADTLKVLINKKEKHFDFLYFVR